MRAALLLRESSVYRRNAFAAGLQRLGYTVTNRHERIPGANDLLILWNRNRSFESVAVNYERAGARVIIAENGYIPGQGGGKAFALALGRHAGAGSWYMGAEPRWPVECAPWRSDGDFVLVAAQRGIGSPGVAMPAQWPMQTVKRLERITKRPVILRKHPGKTTDDPMAALKGAHCVVTWASGLGVKAIIAGIPVFHAMPFWLGRDAAFRLSDNIEQCYTSERGEFLRKLTWAQWKLSEIESGEAFACLLDESRHRFQGAR